MGCSAIDDDSDDDPVMSYAWWGVWRSRFFILILAKVCKRKWFCRSHWKTCVEVERVSRILRRMQEVNAIQVVSLVRRFVLFLCNIKYIIW